MSLRPDSMIARMILRPMRPKPLIATRTAMSPSVIAEPARRFRDRLGGDAEMLVEVGRLGRGPEALHADESAARAEPTLPAETRCRFAGYPHRALGPKNLLVIRFVLRGEQLPRRHRHDRRLDAVLGQEIARPEGKVGFRA